MDVNRKRPGLALSRGLSVAALSAVLACGATATALASRREAPVPIPLRGLITAVGTNELQLQTSNGTVEVALNKQTTHIVRSVMGSTADITAGKRVDLHVIRGTHTVDSVHIEQNQPAAIHRVPVRTPAKTGDHPAPLHDSAGNGPQGMSFQVVSLNGGTLTVRYGNGTTGTFILGPNVKVNEALSGTLEDLGVGETVQVFLGKPGTVARSIVIINA